MLPAAQSAHNAAFQRELQELTVPSRAEPDLNRGRQFANLNRVKQLFEKAKALKKAKRRADFQTVREMLRCAKWAAGCLQQCAGSIGMLRLRVVFDERAVWHERPWLALRTMRQAAGAAPDIVYFGGGLHSLHLMPARPDWEGYDGWLRAAAAVTVCPY